MMKLSILILIFLLTSMVSEAQVLPCNELDTMPVYTNLQEALKNPKTVYRLDLTKQKLKEFPREIYQFTNLNELILDKNKISIIPDSISVLKNLQIFSAERNEIEIFNVKITTLKNLYQLNLADNLIEKIPDQIDDLKSLEQLILWDNPISYYPIAMSEMERLKYLDLLNNQMNATTQERLRIALPKCKIIFSPPCNCMDGVE